MKKFILASGSEPRKQLLEKTGIAFTAEVSNYEEDMTLDLSPGDLAKRLSKGKAEAVAARHKDAVVLGADSFVVFHGQLLGKPHTKERAYEMLAMLSGDCHEFVTGFTIVDSSSGKSYSEVVVSKVYFCTLTSQEIARYLAREDVLHNAGAYRIQDIGSVLVEKIEGSYSNVVGLPLSQVADALKPFGITFF